MSVRFVAVVSVLAFSLAPAAQAAQFFAFTPDPSRNAGVSPEGCDAEPGLARGFLTATATDSPCHSGQFGSLSEFNTFSGQAPTESGAVFYMGPLAEPLAIGGPARLVVRYWAQVGQGALLGQDMAPQLQYEIREKHPAGNSTHIVTAAGPHLQPWDDRVEIAFEIPDYTLSPGGRLQVLLGTLPASESRVLFGEGYADAGITLNVADRTAVPEPTPDPVPDTAPDPQPQPEPSTDGRSGGGSMGLGALAFALLRWRRRQPRVRANSFM